jgi:hypothetical protein
MTRQKIQRGFNFEENWWNMWSNFINGSLIDLATRVSIPSAKSSPLGTYFLAAHSARLVRNRNTR